MRFVWGPAKARSNLRKHSLSFEEAVTVFADPLALWVEDVAHADRALLIGESMGRRLIVTVFVEVDEDTVRIISARQATRRERRQYEGNEGS